jgi:hypothetical protein
MPAVLAALWLVLAAAPATSAPAAPKKAPGPAKFSPFDNCRTQALESGAVMACANLLAVQSDVKELSRDEASRRLEQFAAQFPPPAPAVERSDFSAENGRFRSVAVRGQGQHGRYFARMVVVPREGRGTRVLTCTEEQAPEDPADGRCEPILRNYVKAALKAPKDAEKVQKKAK